MAAIDPPVASAEIGTESRVAGAEDGVVVVAVVVAVARAKALWARQVTVVPKAAESASTGSRRSAAKDKVIVAASRWRTDMIISTSMVKVAMLATRMRVMSTTGKNSIRMLITRTDRATPAGSAIRADSETQVARAIIRTGRVTRAGSGTLAANATRVASELSN